MKRRKILQVVLCIGCMLVGAAQAAEMVCAKVELIIPQEATFERQAFDARLSIENGLPATSIDNLSIALWFKDLDGNVVKASSDTQSQDAMFFITLEDNGVNGTDEGNGVLSNGSVPSAGSGDPVLSELHWLIVPAFDAAGESLGGKQYEIGATLTYSIDGEVSELEVVPDFIVVNAMPMLQLDYFLPVNTYGDDTWTQDRIEPIIPFELGVRVKNNGYGVANNFQITSQQPVITNNEQGLDIDFTIIDSKVQDLPSPKALTVNVGDIPALGSRVASWVMEATLSGEFTRMDVNVEHDQDLGGELTSLMLQENVKIHRLINPVKVEMSGRDDVRDFLAVHQDDMQVYVFESEGVDTPVQNLSPDAIFTLQDSPTGEQTTDENTLTYTLTLPPFSGAVYAEIQDDVLFSEYDVTSVIRVSDGMALDENNFWIHQDRQLHAPDPWHFTLGIFDVDGGGDYTVFLDRRPENHPPVWTGNVAHVRWVYNVGNPVGHLGENGHYGTAYDPFALAPYCFIQGHYITNGGSVQPVLTNRFFSDGRTTTNMRFTATSVVTNTYPSLRIDLDWISGSPQPDDYGIYYVDRWLAEDEQYLQALTGVWVYVGQAGEPWVDTNSGDPIPESLQLFGLQITNVYGYPEVNVATVVWDAVEGLVYDVHACERPWVTQDWHVVGQDVRALSANALYNDGAFGSWRTTMYYQVTYAGEDARTNKLGLYAVIRRPAPAQSYHLLAPPLYADRRFNGEFGEELRESLQGDSSGLGDYVGDEIYVPDVIDGKIVFTMLYLREDGVWCDPDGTPTSYELPAGRGVVVGKLGDWSTEHTFAGPVGHDGRTSFEIQSGEWNLITFSEGWPVHLSTITAKITPVGGTFEKDADRIKWQQPDGSFRTLYYFDGTGSPMDGQWLDANTFQPVENIMFMPGEAVYYHRHWDGSNVTYVIE